jgi:hypothetical protein
MRILLAGAGLATMLLASVAAAAPATQITRSTSGPILALAADGDRAAFVVQGRFKQCVSVMVWQPRRSIAQLQAAKACETNDRGGRTGPPAVALAGTRAIWRQISGGNDFETILRTATVQRTTPRWIIGAGFAHDGYGSFASKPVGDGTLVAFTQDRRCDSHGEDRGRPDSQCPPGLKTGDIVEATIWRLGGRQRCGGIVTIRTLTCTVVARADGELTVLAADAGRIVVRTAGGVRVLTADGHVLRELAVRPLGAALSGTRLALRTATAIEVYDTRTGELATSLPAAGELRLQDLDGDILVTASGETVTLRRLGNGRTTTLRPGRTAYAQLERTGLFVAGARRVTFIPMRDVLRRLGG